MTPADIDDDNTFRPSEDLDEALQREIDEALGRLEREAGP